MGGDLLLMDLYSYTKKAYFLWNSKFELGHVPSLLVYWVQTNLLQLLYLNPFILSRLMLDSSSRIKRLIWINKKWIMFSYFPSDPCDAYAYCGANGYRVANKTLMCRCLPGLSTDHCATRGCGTFQMAMSVRKHLYALQAKAPSVVSRGWNCVRPSWPWHTVDSQSTNAGSMLSRALATLSRRASCSTYMHQYN